MTPERYQQVDKVFQAAIERGPAERAAYLDQACASDPSDFKSDLIFSWSRDGKQLAVARGTVTSDVVLISDFR